MPSSITHDLISQETLTRLNLEVYEDYYFLGSQGGDVLFFYKPLSKKEQNFGKSLHRVHVYSLFRAMVEYLREQTGEAYEKALSYCLGYVTHYCADVCFHPFVYNYVTTVHDDGLVHFQVENDWDVYFLRTRAGREVERYTFPYSPKRLAEEGVLFNMFLSIAQSLGRREIKKNALDGALKNYKRYLKFFHGDCYKKARRFEKLSKTFKISKLARLYPRPVPNAEVIAGESFFELSGGRGHDCDDLFDKAVDDGVRRIPLFLSAIKGAPLPEEEFNFHLLTGEKLD